VQWPRRIARRAIALIISPPRRRTPAGRLGKTVAVNYYRAPRDLVDGAALARLAAAGALIC
jgi:hypothetical protein